MWIYLVLDSHGLNPFKSMKRFIALIPPVGRIVLGVLLVGFIVYGSTKSGGDTNSPSSRVSAPRRTPRLADIVAPEDIAHGWRVVTSAEAESIAEMPAGAVTNDLLRRRGGFDWAFRVEPEGWRFPYRDGVLTGVTVFAKGEVRPDVGTLYFPVPLTNGVSLLPEARWGLLDHAETQSRREGSVFRHAVTTNGSLLLDWRNALVGRDVNSPTNLQMELFSDGSFAWRTDGESTSYLPVFPFDYDGDGLENSVDPEQLSPNSIDAHGTNAEWYRIVCSNVFEVTGTTGVPPVDDDSTDTGTTGILPVDGGSVQFKTNVNTNAYYFVDIVASSGPAPIYFNADRDSRLGSPVVVARVGETNHVPLLIGVEYTVSSTVPISVSAPDAMYATVTTNDERSVTVKWPLEFTFIEDAGTPGAYTVEVVPYDPGVTFTWNSPIPGGGASFQSAAPLSASSCSCWGGSGSSVVFDSSDNCDCGGGCRAEGTGSLEDAEFAVTGGVCRCSHPDEPHEDPPPPPPDPLVGGLSISFSKDAVIFEDEYRDTEDGPLVPRRSTTTRLTVSASGGSFGGSFSLTTRNLGKLIIANGPGPVSLTSGMALAPFETYYATFTCAGVVASGSANDVEVEGSFTENVTGWTESPQDAMTVVKVELRAENLPPANPCPHRHVFGVFEKVELKHRPTSASVTWEMSDGGETSTSEDGFVGENWGGSDWMLRCPLYAKGTGLKAKCGDVEWPFDVTVLEPSGLRTVRPTQFTSFQTGMSAVEMKVPLYLLPETVDFREISIQEIPVDDEPPMNDGCYTNLPIYYQTHTISAGAGRWITPVEGNFCGEDTVRSIPIPSHNPGLGWQWMRLPWGWNKKLEYMENEGVQFQEYGGRPVGGRCHKEISTRYDSFEEVSQDGSVSASRYGWECLRTVYDVYFLNGEIVGEN